MLTLKDKTYAILEPVISAMGFELWGIEFPEQTGGILRVYINSDKGIILDDTVKVSRQIGAVLDVEDIFTGKYTLEVSSPGVDRPLFNKEQFAKFIGHQVKIKLKRAIDERKNYQGIIKEVTDEEVLIVNEEENKNFKLALDLIAKANVIAA